MDKKVTGAKTTSNDDTGQAPGDRLLRDRVFARVFDHAIFRDIDTAALVQKHDPSPAILQINAAHASAGVPALQTHTTITSIPPEGIVIRQPGHYILSEKISNTPWQPNALSHAAIIIDADDVVLDMAGQRLSATIDDNSQHLVGILIKAGCRGISVLDGVLANMGYYGIQADSVHNLTLRNISVCGQVFANLHKRGLCPAGIFISGSERVTITNCRVQYLYAAADACAGIQVLTTCGATISGCEVNHAANYNGAVVGFYYAACMDIITTNCKATHHQSHGRGKKSGTSHTVRGFMPVLSVDLVYDHCVADTLAGSTGDCHGISVILANTVKVRGFCASNVVGGTPPPYTRPRASGHGQYGHDVIPRHGAPNVSIPLRGDDDVPMPAPPANPATVASASQFRVL
ncbi:right-handed parallel beta-helix repeat-containing protein [Kordiimonas sp.]|uniref:right-handed parallel beta-helix repeat-containing protein n=1 Tax=Kordiimonas sp. TaxID=1970157 RepID=UPI003A94FD19